MQRLVWVEEPIGLLMDIEPILPRRAAKLVLLPERLMSRVMRLGLILDVDALLLLAYLAERFPNTAIPISDDRTCGEDALLERVGVSADVGGTGSDLHRRLWCDGDCRPAQGLEHNGLCDVRRQPRAAAYKRHLRTDRRDHPRDEAEAAGEVLFVEQVAPNVASQSEDRLNLSAFVRVRLGLGEPLADAGLLRPPQILRTGKGAVLLGEIVKEVTRMQRIAQSGPNFAA